MFVRTLKKWLTQPVRVVSVEMISEHFRLIVLEADAIRSENWIPGQQIQITVGSGLTGRTYTPMDWDREAGIARILVFLHGTGPGCTWARTVLPGAQYDFLGPTREPKLTFDQPLTIFGDETAFGLALALQEAAGSSHPPRFLFEVSNTNESRDVLSAIGVRSAEVIERRSGGEHFADVSRALSNAAEEGHQIVLSGNARSIQQVRKCIGSLVSRTPRFIVKPYWSPGRKGLS